MLGHNQTIHHKHKIGYFQNWIESGLLPGLQTVISAAKTIDDFQPLKLIKTIYLR
jgi:hypothetical protein